MVESVKRERAILDRLGALGGWVAELQFTFQDALSLYLALEYCPNGERARGKVGAEEGASGREARKGLQA